MIIHMADKTNPTLAVKQIFFDTIDIHNIKFPCWYTLR